MPRMSLQGAAFSAADQTATRNKRELTISTSHYILRLGAIAIDSSEQALGGVAMATKTEERRASVLVLDDRKGSAMQTETHMGLCPRLFRSHWDSAS